MNNFEDRVLNKLDTLGDTTTAIKTKVEELESQNKEQFKLIRGTEKQVNINMTEISNLKERRNGKGWLGKLLVRMFLG